MKKAFIERYLPPSHKAIRMNEFFDLRHNTSTLKEYWNYCNSITHLEVLKLNVICDDTQGNKISIVRMMKGFGNR